MNDTSPRTSINDRRPNLSWRARRSDSSRLTWEEKEISLDQVSKKIPNGSNIYISSTAATAEATLEALVSDAHMADIQIIQMIPGGNLPHLAQQVDRFRTSSFYSFSRGAYFTPQKESSMEGLEDYNPVPLSAVPRLLEEGLMQVDVSIIKVTPPHKGYVSLGMGVEATELFLRHTKRAVIAEVNEHMPWTEGHSKIKVEEIDWWISQHTPLLTTEQLWPEFVKQGTHPAKVRDAIGRHVLKEIPTVGATLRFGVSPLSTCVLPFLEGERYDLGLHTDVLIEEMFRLHERGVFTNRYKTIDTGRTVATQAFGSSDLYDWLDRNPSIEFRQASYVCDAQVMGQIENLISIVGALKVDVTGQVATDSIAHKFYGGVWSDDNSVRGAVFSRGGKPIVVLPSKSLQGRSNIVFELPAGTGVSITRSDIEYVATEYGIVSLYGKSIRERCLALIDIAHPNFRVELLDQCKAHHYISRNQPGKSAQSLYPSELEEMYTTKSGKDVIVRPIKVTDEDKLRDFFHKLSDHSVYLRYFRKLKSMPQRILQRTADVNYDSDMTLIVMSPPNAHNFEIVGIAQWVSDPRAAVSHLETHPEIAFQVRDDWQGEGLGRYLFQRILGIAQKYGLSKVKADVLADNMAMNQIFQHSGVKYVRRADFGVITYIFDLAAEN